MQDIHNFASDVACKRSTIREFMIVGNWLLSLPRFEANRMVSYLDNAHPGFGREAKQLLPRLQV